MAEIVESEQSSSVGCWRGITEPAVDDDLVSSIDEFFEPLKIGERISRFQRRDLAANLPRRRGSAPVELIQPHTISFFEAKRTG